MSNFVPFSALSGMADSFIKNNFLLPKLYAKPSCLLGGEKYRKIPR